MLQPTPTAPTVASLPPYRMGSVLFLNGAPHDRVPGGGDGVVPHTLYPPTTAPPFHAYYPPTSVSQLPGCHSPASTKSDRSLPPGAPRPMAVLPLAATSPDYCPGTRPAFALLTGLSPPLKVLTPCPHHAVPRRVVPSASPPP